MTECLLCNQPLLDTPSWKSVLSIEEPPLICAPCQQQFEKWDSKEVAHNIDQLTSLYTYNEAMQTYLHQFKFLQDIALAAVFKNDLRKVVRKSAARSKAIIVPIPMHPERKIARTFAHVEELLKSADINYTDVLEKVHLESMGTKTKAERLNMGRLFQVNPNHIIQPETYILIDDIYTTGTTLSRAATVLKEAGATSVEAVTLIRAK